MRLVIRDSIVREAVKRGKEVANSMPISASLSEKIEEAVRAALEVVEQSGS